MGWRRWRGPVMAAAMVLLGGVVIALLQVGPPVSGPLDPSDTGPAGTHALVALLTGRGQAVVRVSAVPAAVAQASRPGSAIVITSSGRLASSQLSRLATAGASLLLVAPDRAALAALAPQVSLAGRVPVRAVAPGCGLPGAVAAGTAELGGSLLRSPAAGVSRCYPGFGPRGVQPSLVRFASGGRVITVVGTGVFLDNRHLGRDGNASLAMNLLGTSQRIVWLVPGPPAAAVPPGGSSLSGLIPLGVYLVAAQLGIAALATALWRVRRFGPLVPEPIPVAVRASETVEGHARLYQARRARDRVAAALRGATLARITARLGLPRALPDSVICQELASRTGRDPGEVRALLFGPPPDDDAGLVALAAGLDVLEGQVRNP